MMKWLQLGIISIILYSASCLPVQSPDPVYPAVRATVVEPREITKTASQSFSTNPIITPSPVPTTSDPDEGTIPSIKLAWFYKPPTSGDVESIAKSYDFFILTRMDEGERDFLIKYGSEAPILQYLLFSEIHNPGSCTAQPNHNQVAEQAGDYCRLEKAHPNWFLLDVTGSLVRNSNHYVMMDPGNAEWRNYWLERANLSQEAYGWSGVFLDNVEASLDKRLSIGSLPDKYPDDASYQAVIEDNLRYLYTTYFQTEGKPLFANIIALKDPAVWFRYLSYLDGAMLENFAVDWNNGYLSPEEWESQLTLAEKTQGLGKDILLVSQGTVFDLARQEFSLASYLLCNQGRAYFRYSNDAAYDQNWPYENYSVDLGKPEGERYRDGNVWVRFFRNGVVRVNPSTHSASINFYQ